MVLGSTAGFFGGGNLRRERDAIPGQAEPEEQTLRRVLRILLRDLPLAHGLDAGAFDVHVELLTREPFLRLQLFEDFRNGHRFFCCCCRVLSVWLACEMIKPQDAIPFDPVEFTFAMGLLFSDTKNWRSPKVRVEYVNGKPVTEPAAAWEIVAELREHNWPKLKLESFVIRSAAYSRLIVSDALCRHFPFPKFDYNRVTGAALELAATFPVTPRGWFDQAALVKALDAQLGNPSTPKTFPNRNA